MNTLATLAASKLLRVLPRTQITRAVGRLCDLGLPAQLANTVVGLYSRAYRVNLTESVQPEGAFESFDAFFTRKLLPGMRPLATDESAVVSPADGSVEDLGPIEARGSLRIKGRDYQVADLVGDEEEATRYEGGQFAIIYLSPRDYHRVHAPVSGQITLVRSLPGDLYPVNSIGERHVPSLFARNRRVAIVIDTASHGRVTVVMVGAMIVGRITVSAVPGRDVPLGVHRISPAQPVERGEEIGIFHLGSTAVVFLEKGAARTFASATGPIRLGQALGVEREG